MCGNCFGLWSDPRFVFPAGEPYGTCVTVRILIGEMGGLLKPLFVDC